MEVQKGSLHPQVAHSSVGVADGWEAVSSAAGACGGVDLLCRLSVRPDRRAHSLWVPEGVTELGPWRDFRGRRETCQTESV